MASVDVSPISGVKEAYRPKQPLLREAAVGISQYISSHTPFTAVFKHRFSDFHVHEVNLLGEVIHLTSLASKAIHLTSLASNVKPVHYGSPQDLKSQSELEKSQIGPVGLDRSQMEKCQTVSDILNLPLASQLSDLLARLIPSISIPSPTEKAKRGAIHTAIRTHFPQQLGTSVEGGDIRIERFDKRRHGERKAKDREQGSGDYLHFTLYKEDRDTMVRLNLDFWIITIDFYSIWRW